MFFKLLFWNFCTATGWPGPAGAEIALQMNLSDNKLDITVLGARPVGQECCLPITGPLFKSDYSKNCVWWLLQVNYLYD